MITNDFLQNLEKYAPGFSMENFGKHNPKKKHTLRIVSQLLFLMMLALVGIGCTTTKPFVAQKVTCNGSYEGDKFYKFERILEIQQSGHNFSCSGTIKSFGRLDLHHVGAITCDVRGISEKSKSIKMIIPSEWVFRQVIAMNGWKVPTDGCDGGCEFSVSGGYGVSFVQIETFEKEVKRVPTSEELAHILLDW